MSDPNTKYFVLLNDEGAIVAQYKCVRNWNDLHAKEVYWMERLFVLLEHRRRGYAQMMVVHFLATASTTGKGLSFLALFVNKRNAGARALYDKTGFKVLEYDFMVHAGALEQAGIPTEAELAAPNQTLQQTGGA